MSRAPQRDPRRRLLPWLLACVLVSGAGLLGIGVVSLWRAAGDAEARARLAADAEASRAARALRAKLLQEGALAAATLTFDVRAGALVVPDQVAWLDAPPRFEDALPFDLRAALARARTQEFAEGEAGAAAATLQAAGGLSGLTDVGKRELALAQGFLALRHADAAAVAAAVAAVGKAGAIDPAQAGGVLLLCAAAKAPLPAEALAALPRAEETRAPGIVARLREAGVGVDLDGVARQVAVIGAQRATLRRVQALLSARLATWLDGETAAVAADGDDVFLWFPTARGEGRGGVAPARALLAKIAGDDLASPLVAVSIGPAHGEGAAFVVEPSVAIVPRHGASAARPWLLTVLLAVLAGSFGVGLAMALRALRREAQATAARSEFLTSVTHELRTPLAALRLLAEMLDEGRVTKPEQQREYYRMLAGETVRLQALIDNVLDLGRMERGERALDLRLCELGEVVRDAVAVFAPVAARDGRTVTLRGDDRALSVRADRSGLTQAFLNVLDNARKYGEGERIEVAITASADLVRVAVRDFGPGVPVAERARVFERFVRGGAQASGSVPGVGLGLYLARAIALAHGGDLRCEDPQGGGRGAVFVFLLPLEQQTEVRA